MVQSKFNLDAGFITCCFLKFWICMHERDITSLYYACTESLHTCFLKTIRTSNWSSYSPKYHLHLRSSSSGDGSQNHRLQRCIIGGFFFFIFFENKNFKNICPFWNISKISPGRPPIGRQALSVFFSSYSQRGFWQKKRHVAHPRGDRGLSPVGGGRQGPLPLYKPWPPYATTPFVIWA